MWERASCEVHLYLCYICCLYFEWSRIPPKRYVVCIGWINILIQSTINLINMSAEPRRGFYSGNASDVFWMLALGVGIA